MIEAENGRAPALPEANTTQRRRQWHQRHLLFVVEDQPDIRDAYAALLLSERFAVVVARDGQEALDELRRGLRPCVILLDLAMPNVDGWSFRQKQLADARFADVPVIAVTAYGRVPERLPAGIEEVLTKPVDPDELLAVVHRHCDDVTAHPSVAPTEI